MNPTPSTSPGLSLRRADFASLPEALDYAARGDTGFNFYSARGGLVAVATYRELRDRAVAMARGMVRAGLPRGARLLLVADTDPDSVAVFLACQYAGVVPVPVAVPTSLGGRDAYVAALRRQLSSSGAVAAAAPEGLLDYLRAAAEGTAAAGAVAGPEEFRALPGAGVDPRPFGARDPCYLQFSSGSTRFPLGVSVPQRSLMSNAHAIANHGLAVVPGDRCVSWLPLYHDMGLVGFMLTPLLTQLSVDYIATHDFARRPLLWPTLMSRNGGSLSYSPTFGYDLCSRRVDEAAARSLDLSRWRVAGIGGDMIQPPVLERFAEAFRPAGFRPGAFVASYGLAEATLAVTFAELGRGLRLDAVDRRRLAEAGVAEAAGEARGAELRGFVVCGSPLPGHAVEVRDEAGRPLPERRLGGVFVRGPSVAAGYFGEPEATARVFRDGWLDTGDLGYLAGGALVVTGRRKDLIIVNGRNIWPQDLEWAVERLPGVRRGDAAAFAVDDEDGPERIVLLVQCRTTDPDLRARLDREARDVVRRVSGADCRVVLIPPHGLPQTSSGKMSRSRAKENYRRGVYGDRGTAVAPPGSVGRPAARRTRGDGAWLAGSR